MYRLPSTKNQDTLIRIKGIANDIIRAIFTDSRDRIWVGTNGSGLDCLEKGRITNFTTTHGLPNNYIYALGEDNKGRIWVGAYNGGLAVLENGRFRSLAIADIADQPIWVIHMDSDGDVWVGTDHAGLLYS